MAYRDPVVIYVNYFFAFQDDKKRRNPAERAASLIQGALAFKDLVVGGSLEPEGFGGKSGPLCSEQYRYLSLRIPILDFFLSHTCHLHTNPPHLDISSTLLVFQ